MESARPTIANLWIPQPNLPLIEWLPGNINLPAQDADDPGPYKVETVPYFWGVMHAVDNNACWMVVLQKAAQIGWTILLAADVCKVAKTDPNRCLMLFPKEEKGRKFMDEKLVPVIEASPLIAEVIDISTSRKSGQRATQKNFPGGWVQAIGSNSVSNVKSTTAPRCYVEEPDDTNRDVGDQGDSIKHLRERLKRRSDKKLIIGGTPAVADLSQVEHYVKMGTMRVLPITCHDCGEAHVLDWENVSWQSKEQGTEHPVFGLNQPDTAVYSCPHCGSLWDDWQRKQNILNTCKTAFDGGDLFAGWVKTQCGDDYGPNECEPIETFFELGELYVCMNGTSLADVVRDYLEAEHEARTGDEGARIVFQNNKLGRPYRYAADLQLDADKLKEKAEEYPLLWCPSGGLVICAGVDVQHDRVAIVIRAWGRAEESWQLHWGEIDGDCTDKQDDVWGALDNLLFQPFTHERFGQAFLSGVSIDSSDGTTSNAVYNWVRTRAKRYPRLKILAIKGDTNDMGKKEIFTLPRAVDRRRYDKPSKADRFGVKIYHVGTHKAKDIISNRLVGTTAYMHSNANVRQDYWQQVTAEVKAPSKKHGGILVYQKLPGRANEGLDCEVYALHNAHANGVHKYTEAGWDRVEATLGQRTLFTVEEAPAQPDKPKPAQDKKPAPGLQHRGGGLGRGSWGGRL